MKLEDRMYSKVSIHAPVRVRQKESCSPGTIDSFNSRTREGATNSIKLFGASSGVSIHAPVRVRPQAYFVVKE